MTYFVFAEWGSCRDGDRNSEMTVFAVESDAAEYAEKVKRFRVGAKVTVVRGEEVEVA